jgi:phage-related protein
MYLIRYNTHVISLSVRFYKSTNGREPVREWLKNEVSAEAKRTIGVDIKTVQEGWPLGMPLVRKMAPNLWEARCTIPEGIARVLFTVVGSDMVLLHGFVKKSQATQKDDLNMAIKRRDKVRT